MNRIANVTVPQGIGDIFWIYQKLYNHFEVINFNIMYLETGTNDEIQRRSMNTIKDWNKVNNVGLVDVTEKQFNEFVKRKQTLRDVLAPLGYFNNERQIYTFEYQVNSWLEEGTKLEDIDDMSVMWNIDLPQTRVEGLEEEYVLLFVSDTTRHRKLHKNLNLWSEEDWVEFTYKIIKDKLNNNIPVKIIGKSFDEYVMKTCKQLLENKGIKTDIFTNLDGRQLNYIISQSKFFIGYQSGLNILADNFGVNQIMIYFPTLDKMKDCWVSENSKRNNKFNWAYFNDSQDKIINNLNI